MSTVQGGLQRFSPSFAAVAGFLTRGGNACTEPASALCSSGGHDACGRSQSSPWEMEVNCLASTDGAGRGRCLLADRRGERCHHYMYAFYWLRRGLRDDGRWPRCNSQGPAARPSRSHQVFTASMHDVDHCRHAPAGLADTRQEHKKQPSLSLGWW